MTRYLPIVIVLLVSTGMECGGQAPLPGSPCNTNFWSDTARAGFDIPRPYVVEEEFTEAEPGALLARAWRRETAPNGTVFVPTIVFKVFGGQGMSLDTAINTYEQSEHEILELTSEATTVEGTDTAWMILRVTKLGEFDGHVLLGVDAYILANSSAGLVVLNSGIATFEGSLDETKQMVSEHVATLCVQ